MHPPHYVATLPFVILLAAIALLPVIRSTAHWWESNLHRLYVACGLAALTVLYYALWHPAAGASNVGHLLNHAIIDEYIPFVVLLFSLYTIAGGIRITGNLVATPRTNTSFLLVGGVLASFIGTTGAAMLLIRPLLETNAERKYVQHTVVFFIFIVCNCGGCLLPVGDPPLFLGYLRGVPFTWTLYHLWPHWLVVNGILLTVYYVWDRWIAYPREATRDVGRDVAHQTRLQILGLFPNAILLVGITLCVALLSPDRPVPGLSWRPPPYLREIAELVLVAMSLVLGSTAVRQANRFNYHAIVEVAVLFLGVFLCMQPALEILRAQGATLGLDGPHTYFWVTGSLSSALDNAPTYLVFFETAAGDSQFADHAFATLVAQSGDLAESARRLLVAISLGSVFMGAMTYIGNGPNFMVKTIATQAGVTMPSFFGYTLRYSVPILVPVFLLANWFLL